MPHLTKAVHTPKLLVLLNEVSAMYRQVFIDGRPLPVDPNPSWNGYSTAVFGPGPDRIIPEAHNWYSRLTVQD